ncbi:MAG: ATP-binding protein [Armatimonadetes bacterium]|nr:ATP-binding protein [Armatimonadota bacterium]MBS1728487.1 ATP-binding protein [Armatimonadota bacterium]
MDQVSTPTTEIEALKARVTELEQQLASKDKTLTVLVDRFRKEQAEGTSAFQTLATNTTLKHIVTKKTHELEERNMELENAHAALSMAQSELLQAQKLESIGRLASGVAHEINTPVQFVGDSIHFLAESIDDILSLMSELLVVMNDIANGQMSIQMVEATVETLCEKYDYEYLTQNIPKSVKRSADGLARVAEIVQSMKAFAHPDQKTMSAVDINSGLATTLTVAKNEYKYVANVETEFGEIPFVQGYLGEMNQVFLNLIINASHAIEDVHKKTGEQGKITLRTRRDGSSVVVEISDTGSGIPLEIRNQIFDPFFTTKEVGKGTGQGLALAHKVVTQMHGGEIWFESELGKGTTFFLRFPVEQTGIVHQTAA